MSCISVVLADTLVITHFVPFVTCGRSKEHKIKFGATIRVCVEATLIHILQKCKNSVVLLPAVYQVLYGLTYTQHNHRYHRPC